MSVSSFRELTVWQKSFWLVKDIYALTAQLPPNERYALADQMQRCAVSIPSNIAEGQQRNNRKEYRQFIGISRGSAGELETQLLLAAEIYDVDTAQLIKTVHEIQKMLFSLYKKLEPIT